MGLAMRSRRVYRRRALAHCLAICTSSLVLVVGCAQPEATPTPIPAPATVPAASPVASPVVAKPAASPVPAASPTAPPFTGQTHTVGEGETLRTIAEQEYGNGDLWRRIFDANRDIIGDNPDAIKIGQSLRIPPRE